jgi:UDP-N-acetylglucosamine enolpyruvyl transferase
MTNLVNANTNLQELSVEQVNWLIDEAGSDIIVDEARYIGKNASHEYQYEVMYDSSQAGSYVVNHAFVDFDLQGDPRLIIHDLDVEEDLFAD